MFTGLIEEIGEIKSIIKRQNSAQITISATKVLKDVKLGDSINTNGVCLTVVAFTNDNFKVDVMPETIRKSNLEDLKNGNKVNLERALKLSDRLGGHIVLGHIDGIGIINDIQKEDNSTWITIKAPQNILKYVIQKGSIAMDGTSLTVAYVDNEIFKVSIIPLTKEKTILLNKNIGEKINLECDMVGKYIEKFINFNKENKQETLIDMNFLEKNGFI